MLPTDRNGVIQAFETNKKHLSKVKKILADGGYSGEPFSKQVKRILKAEMEISKRNEVHMFAVIPKRWVVERSSLGWRNAEGFGKKL